MVILTCSLWCSLRVLYGVFICCLWRSLHVVYGVLYMSFMAFLTCSLWCSVRALYGCFNMLYMVFSPFRTSNRPQRLPSKSCLVNNSLICPGIVRNCVIPAASLETPYSLLNEKWHLRWQRLCLMVRCSGLHAAILCILSAVTDTAQQSQWTEGWSRTHRSELCFLARLSMAAGPA
jgi:hypothetical protein